MYLNWTLADVIIDYARGRPEAQHYAQMEDGSWNFFENRRKNISDLSQLMDIIILLFLSIVKILLYLKIYKHISKTFNLTTIRETENRKKFKKVRSLVHYRKRSA